MNIRKHTDFHDNICTLHTNDARCVIHQFRFVAKICQVSNVAVYNRKLVNLVEGQSDLDYLNIENKPVRCKNLMLVFTWNVQLIICANVIKSTDVSI